MSVPAAAENSGASERGGMAQNPRVQRAMAAIESPRTAGLAGATTDDDSAEEESRLGGSEIFTDPVYVPRPRYEFPREWRGPALTPPSKVLEGIEVMRSLLGSSIFSPAWLPVEEPDDIGALDPVGFPSLEELIRTAPMSLLVDKLSLFGLACFDDLAVAMSVLPNTTVWIRFFTL